ncbi:UNC-like C-terminal-domain-containing protein [Neocallimastix sp. 'constans']
MSFNKYNKYSEFNFNNSQSKNIFNNSYNKKEYRNNINEYSNENSYPSFDIPDYLNFNENKNLYVNTTNFSLSNIFKGNSKNNNGFNNIRQNVLRDKDKMDIDLPVRNDNINEIHNISNLSNYNLRNFNTIDSRNTSKFYHHFHNNYNNISAVSTNSNSNVLFNLENEFNKKQSRYHRNFEIHPNSSFTIKDNSIGYPSTLNSTRFFNNTSSTLYSNNSQNSFQKLKKYNINSLNTPSFINKFTPLSSISSIFSSSNNSERSNLIRQQERVPIRENSKSNVIKKFSYTKYIWNKINSIFYVPLKLLQLSISINLKLLFTVATTIAIFYLNDTPGDILSKELRKYNIDFNYSIHINIVITLLLLTIYCNQIIDFILYKPIRRNEDKKKMKNIRKRLLNLENSINGIKNRLNYKSNQIKEISKAHENHQTSFEKLNYYLTIYENIFKLNTLHLEQQKAILKQIENCFDKQIENIINTKNELDNLSIKVDQLFSKSKEILNNEIGHTEVDKIKFIKNYIKELDQLFPPEILITWNKDNNDIEISTDLYNTIGQRYFSKEEYNKQFNVQYPSIPTLPLKEFLWKNKELVEKLMLNNFEKYLSKKSEITELLNENINKYRQQFKSNANIILNTIDKKDFLNSLKSFIFLDIKNKIKEKKKLDLSQYFNEYSTNTLPDYSTALYGSTIIESLTTDTQPITSENPVINRLHIINNPPILALENTLLPNSCWAMKGTSGSLGINLSHYIYPTSITIEHLPSWNSKDPKSAPKLMTLVAIDGYEISINNNKINDMNITKNRRFNEKITFPIILGTFQYNINTPNYSQTFNLNQNIINRLKLLDIKINKVQLQIHSNWGNEKYTCIYRVRIHGNDPVLLQSPLIPL